jgi:catechol 2,3-dioxygenase-like lactoylglutathione lyase family enzyme
MTGTDATTSTQPPDVGTIDMKLEVVTVPVSDVDQSKRFYRSLGWRLDADIAVDEASEAAGRYMQDVLHIAAL